MQRQAQLCPRPSTAFYHFMSTTILTCGGANRASNFVKNCQDLSRRGSTRTRIIQPVTAVEGDKFGTQSSQRLRRIALRSFVAALGLLGIAYAGDYGIFRYRVAKNRQPFGSVSVEHYDAVLHKDGKSEFIFDPPVQETCVHSLFPHAGDPPCWFLSRHAEQRTDI
jgi:hypothetical protein